MEKVKVKVVNKGKGKLPKYETSFSAGMDVRAALNYKSDEEFTNILGSNVVLKGAEKPENRKIVLHPQARVLVPTGLFVEIPEGYEIQVRPRSGLAIKKGITVLNSPGTIDSDYRGEVGVILINNGSSAVVIENDERVAQLVLSKVEQITWDKTDKLSDTKRGVGGFNSTGNK